jgi:hypothetical protein
VDAQAKPGHDANGQRRAHPSAASLRPRIKSGGSNPGANARLLQILPLDCFVASLLAMTAAAFRARMNRRDMRESRSLALPSPLAGEGGPRVSAGRVRGSRLHQPLIRHCFAMTPSPARTSGVADMRTFSVEVARKRESRPSLRLLRIPDRPSAVGYDRRASKSRAAAGPAVPAPHPRTHEAKRMCSGVQGK